MYEPFLQYGAIGIVLAWFMFRSEKKTEALTTAINNSNKVVLCLIDAVSGCPTNSNSKDGANTGRQIRTEQLNAIKEEILRA